MDLGDYCKDHIWAILWRPNDHQTQNIVKHVYTRPTSARNLGSRVYMI